MSEQWVRIPIIDLGCAAGVQGLERRLMELPGVIEVAVNPATEAAYVRFETTVCAPDRLRDSVERAGYRTATPVGL